MRSIGKGIRIFYFSALELGVPDAANNHTLEVATRLARIGHSVYLFIPKPETEFIKPDNIQLILTPAIGTAHSFLRTFTFYLFLPSAAWKHFARYQPDVLYTRFSFLELLAVLPLRLMFRSFHVAEINGTRSLESQGPRIKRRIIELLERLSLKLCDSAIAVTSELRKWISETSHLSEDKIVVISNGVDVDLFTPNDPIITRSRLGLDPDTEYINFTGSLKPWHGIHTVIEALPLIVKGAQKKVMLLVVGDGPEKVRLKSLAKNLGMENNIVWVGRVEKVKVPDYINASSVGLSPFSIGRNIMVGSSALKVFEYISCARPIVTTRLSTSYDELILQGGFGLLVPPDDPEAFARAVLELLNDPARATAMGVLGRQEVLEHFSWEKIAQQTEQFLLQQLKKKTPE